MSFKFSNENVVLFLLIFVDVTENKMFLVKTGNRDIAKTVEKLTEKEMGQDYSDDDDIALDAATRFNPVIHKRKDLSYGENKESFWNKEGSGFEPEIVSEADDYPKYSNRRRIEEEDSFWNRKGNELGPEILSETDASSINSTLEIAKKAEEKKEPDYDIPADFLKMLTKPAE